MLNKNTWGCKKVQGQEEQALIHQLKPSRNLQGIFTTMIGFITLDCLLYIGDDAKKVS